MKNLLFIPFLLFAMICTTACPTNDVPTPTTGQPTNSEEPINEGNPDESGNINNPDISDDQNNSYNPDKPNGKTLIAYFSAQGHTQAIAERIVELTGADIYRIEAAEPYTENPYDDSDRIQNEAYNGLRPGVANLPDVEIIAQYDTIFVGSPCWWHQPAMVVCTFLEAYDLTDKVIVPFLTYGATTYLNESMQTIYRVTPNSKHIPETLPEDLNPDDITIPGPADDEGIDMPGNANGTEAWLLRIKQ